MRVSTNAPSSADVKELKSEPAQDDNPVLDFFTGIRDGMCDVITSFGESQGCSSDTKPPSLQTFCNIVNGILGGLGCEQIPDPDL